MKDFPTIESGRVSAGNLRTSLNYSYASMGQLWKEQFGESFPDDFQTVSVTQAKDFLEGLMVPKQGRREEIKTAAREFLKGLFPNEEKYKTYEERLQEVKTETLLPVVQTLVESIETEEKAVVSVPLFVKIRNWAVDAICAAIVIGHAGLVWYDCSDIWGTPGLIGGGLAFSFMVLVFLYSTDVSKNITSEIAVWFAALIDVGAFFVHHPTFLKYGQIDESTTTVLCIFICAIAWGTLFLFRHSKTA